MKVMSEHKQKQLDELRDDITFILTSTSQPTTDANIRMQVANSIIRAMRMSKLRGGSIEVPHDTDIYRFARIIKDATNWEEFSSMCLKMTEKHSPIDLLTRHDLKWKTRFELPEDIKKLMEPKKEIVGLDLSKPKEEPKSNNELMLLQEIDKLRSELEKLKKLFVNHTHVNGDVCEVKKINI